MIEEKAKREGENQIKNHNKIKETRTRIRVEEDLINCLREEAKIYQMSLNSYVNFVLTAFTKKEEISFEERINKPEKKEVESRVFFTLNEAEVLKKQAQENGWSLTQEIRYRVISTLSKKPKLSKEEKQIVRGIRSSINVLGANVNRIIREDRVVSNDNIEICKELIELVKELKDKISYLEECSSIHFKLK